MYKRICVSMKVQKSTLSLVTTSVYREKKHPYDCFTEDKSIPMTALWCPEFSNHG